MYSDGVDAVDTYLYVYESGASCGVCLGLKGRCGANGEEGMEGDEILRADQCSSVLVYQPLLTDIH